MNHQYRRDQPEEQFRMPDGSHAKLLPAELVSEVGPVCPTCGAIHPDRPLVAELFTCPACGAQFWAQADCVAVWTTRELVRVAPPNGTFG